MRTHNGAKQFPKPIQKSDLLGNHDVDDTFHLCHN